MKIDWETPPRPGSVACGEISFGSPHLANRKFPTLEVTGSLPGRKLCVMAGIHVNEASSIEAAIELRRAVDPEKVRGKISIIPIVNVSAIPRRSTETPEDRKNLHWLFPGAPDGSYSECLAYALLSEWAVDADVLLDLHGGDRGERLCDYVVYQKTADKEWNDRCRRLAACFDAEFAVGLSAKSPGATGRCCTGLADRRRFALVCESGINGALDPRSVAWHPEGIVNVARHLGIVVDGLAAAEYAQETLEEYEFVTSPLDGMIYPKVESGSRIRRGDEFAELRDRYGRKLSSIRARVGGIVLMHTLLQFVEKNEIVGSIAYSIR